MTKEDLIILMDKNENIKCSYKYHEYSFKKIHQDGKPPLYSMRGYVSKEFYKDGIAAEHLGTLDTHPYKNMLKDFIIVKEIKT